MPSKSYCLHFVEIYTLHTNPRHGSQRMKWTHLSLLSRYERMGAVSLRGTRKGSHWPWSTLVTFRPKHKHKALSVGLSYLIIRLNIDCFMAGKCERF